MQLSLISFGQSFSNNPTSYYGFGQLNKTSNAIYSALGNNSINFVDSTQLNTNNPASYSYLSKGNTLFFLGASGRVSNYISGNGLESVTRSNFLLDQYALGFKVINGLGMTMGLRPFAQKGYSISENFFTGMDSLEFTYEGIGGLHEVFYGIGYMPLRTSRMNISVGANLGYVFGKTSNSRQSRLMSNAFPYGESMESLRLNALNIEVSSNLDLIISKSQKLMISSSYSPNNLPYNLKSIDILSSVALGTNGRPTYQILNADTNQMNYALSKFTVGFNYSITLPKWKIQNKELQPQLDIVASYCRTESALRNEVLVQKNLDYNVHSYHFGVQFKPEKNLFENASVLTLPERITYRVGAYSNYTQINSVQYSDYGITFGFGLPTLIQRSLSSVNVSFQLGKNTRENQGIKELYGAIQLGIVFAPSSFEKWFIKRKLD